MKKSLNLSQHPVLPYVRYAEYAAHKAWYFPERRLLDYLVTYVQEGNLIIKVDGTEHLFSAGEFCLLQPNDLHSFKITSNTITPYVHLDIFYNQLREQSFMTKPGQIDLSAYSDIIQPRLNDMNGMKIPLKLNPSIPARFKETLLKLVGTFQNKDIIDQLDAQLLATELVVSIIKDHQDDKTSVHLQHPHSLNWIISYFSYHLSEPISLLDMAQRAQLSPSRFSAVFRRQFGLSPHRYLLQMRIKHAQELLRSTELTVHEIAEYCGFANVHHFSHSFKKMTGQSPGSYRKDTTN